MANRRWDLCVASKGKDGQWRSNKVGVIFEGDGGKLQIKIDPGVSISSPDGVLVTGWLPKERDGEQRRGGGPRESNGPGATNDDQIPFAPVGDIG